MSGYDLAGFGKFLRGLKVDGYQLGLEPFQRDIFRDHFGPAVEEVVIIPKKNYKTTSLAALALYHGSVIDEPEVPIVAAAAKQAGVMYRQMVKIVRGNGTKLEGKERYRLAGTVFEVREGSRMIRVNGGQLYVMAADSDTADGVIPTLALVDELHRHRNADTYGVLSDGLDSRNGRMVTISTAGAKQDSALGHLRERAHGYRNRKVDGRHTRYAKGSFVMHEWALLEGKDDPDNLNHVKMANPAKTMTRAKLARRRGLPTMTPGRWLRFACGIWTEGDEPAVDPALWDAGRIDIGRIQPGDTVMLAVQPGDSAWIGYATPAADGVSVVKAEHLGEDRSGVKIERRLLEIRDTYDVLQVAYPRLGFLRSAELMSAAGLYMVEVAAQSGRYGVISTTFDRMVSAGLLHHDGDPELRASVLSAAAKDSETGWRYVMTPKAAGLFAVANALHQATAVEPEPPRVVMPA